MNAKKTPISELGEFGLIDHLTQNIKTYNKQTIKGIGDDTAVLNVGAHYSLVTKDLLTEGVHFNLMYTPLKHLGYKAVAVNLSDICAMNGTPRQVVVGLAISSRFTVEALEELYEGVLMACNRYKVDLVGGDTCSSQSGLTISITALGDVTKEHLCYRSGAQNHDLLCVSGNLGAAYAGLLVLEREKQVFKANPGIQPDLSKYNYVLERQLKPEPRVDIIEVLRKNEILPTAMIDISDGLASEIKHICKSSQKGAVIYEEKIPIDRQTEEVAKEFDIDPITFALNGGEDYELLFTIAQKDYEKIQAVENISIIGHISNQSEECLMVSTSGEQIALKAQGWDAFKKDESEGN